jgi:aspartyl-tRNA(Asn)/glutamyl-tRNA(Gln) amidotransferase subunit C
LVSTLVFCSLKTTCSLIIDILMALTETEITKIARLARLHVSDDQMMRWRDDLNDVMRLIESLQSIDTKGVEPLAHPLCALLEVELRLREDAALPTNTPEERDHLMQNAPARQDGLFLVPRVIE